MVPFLLVLLFIVVPLAELYVLIQVGQAIGALPTIAILVVDSILGSLLLRSQGRAVWRRFNEALRDHRPPAREVLDGALVIFGGALLLTPGFLTDVLGLVLLLPPTRAVLRRVLFAWFGRRFVVAHVAGAAAGAGARRARRRRPAPGGTTTHEPYDVEGEAVDVDPPHLQR
ncbi:MAG: FxsA family protein [Solirubrobacteraceae bacterium]